MSKIPASEASDNLTVGEVKVIQRHHGTSMEKIGGIDLLVSLVWAYERRAALANSSELPTWDSFDSWTLTQLNEYFAPEEIEVDPSEPDTESGKGI